MRVVAIILLITVGTILGYEFGYQTGQIDVLSGQKICYELSARSDNSIIWQKMNPCQEGEKDNE